MVSPFGLHPQNESPLKIGVIGLGQMSDMHFEAIAKDPQSKLMAIADVNGRLLREQGRRLGVTRLYEDYHKLLEAEDLDVVDIVLPHYLHARVSLEVLESGKTVICEKPLGLTHGEFAKIERLSLRSGKSVYVKHYLRYSRLHNLLSENILQGKIGNIYLVSLIYTTDSTGEMTDPHSWRGNARESGGGVLQDVGIHGLDLITEFFGLPEALSAITRKLSTLLPEKAEDLALVRLEYPELIVNLICNANDRTSIPGWRKTFFGSRGTLEIRDYGKSKQTLTGFEGHRVAFEEEEEDWWVKTNLSAVGGILSSIHKHHNPSVSISEASNTQRIVELCYLSAKHNGRRMELKI